MKTLDSALFLGIVFYDVLDLFIWTRYTFSTHIISEKAFGELVSKIFWEWEKQINRQTNMNKICLWPDKEKVTITNSVRGKFWGVLVIILRDKEGIIMDK